MMKREGGSRAAQKRQKKKERNIQVINKSIGKHNETEASADKIIAAVNGKKSLQDSQNLRTKKHKVEEKDGIDTRCILQNDKASRDSRRFEKNIVELDADEDFIINPHILCDDFSIDSGLRARMMLEWMIAPVNIDMFYANYWEKQPLVLKRSSSSPNYNSGFISTSEIKEIIANHCLYYGQDLDVTNYINGHRVTLNPLAKGEKEKTTEANKMEKNSDSVTVNSKFVWEKFYEGCSLRMPCPQKHCDKVYKLLATLEEEVGCMVGSNVYLTPAGNQGFAPHYDDIEAFLIQIEGSKRWKVYAPLDENSTLPRTSSGNLTVEEVKLLGKPLLDIVLESGDTLYFPRGWVHQAVAMPGKENSLHLTVSCYQSNCWADMMNTIMPMAISTATAKHVALREGLPRDYLNYMGVAAGTGDSDPRKLPFKALLKEKMKLIFDEAIDIIDNAADIMGVNFISDRLPPSLLEEEESKTCLSESQPIWTGETLVKCVRRGLARLVVEDGMAVVYHCMDNARVHHEQPLRPIEFELDDAPAIEMLLSAYPEPVLVTDLPHPPTEDLDDKIEIAKVLYAEGFLMVAEKI